jgi:hypothetical protein
MAKRDTKRNVDLVSSHNDDKDNDGPFLLSDDEPEGLSMPSISTSQSQSYDNNHLPPHTLPLKLKPGETLVYYEEFIPDPNQ